MHPGVECSRVSVSRLTCRLRSSSDYIAADFRAEVLGPLQQAGHFGAVPDAPAVLNKLFEKLWVAATNVIPGWSSGSSEARVAGNLALDAVREKSFAELLAFSSGAHARTLLPPLAAAAHANPHLSLPA
jgi:hypothetical protein